MRNVKGIMILLAFSVVFLSSCGGNDTRYSKKPDDELSRAIKSEMASEFDYHGREESESGIVFYDFYLEKNEKESIAEFVNIANEIIGNDKITIKIWTRIPGGEGQILGLKNYLERDEKNTVTDHICYLYIKEEEHAMNRLVNDPQLYTSIRGIEELHIDESMQKKAEEAGIDWYEIWPDLETIVVEKDD